MISSKFLLPMFWLVLAQFLVISGTIAQTTPPAYVVLFTHIEDNTPMGELGTAESRQSYLLWRDRLIGVARLFQKHQVRWVLEPDWKFLIAALMYEDSALQARTNHKNLLRFLKEDLNVAIDPHSHENGGYNYTDVAHLLDSLGVGGSTVVGGHVWDPSLPQFAEWDRFRVPQPGAKYPWAWWRGDILMGSATPSHVNDPIVSGVWRPKDRDHFFEDDSLGNIVCVGQYKNAKGQYKSYLQSVMELIDLYANAQVPPQYMLTTSKHVSPGDITAPFGLQNIEDSLLVPLRNLEQMGKVKLTDFTALVADWRTIFHSQAFIYHPDQPSQIKALPVFPRAIQLYQNYPNPFNPSTVISFQLPVNSRVTLKVFDVNGRIVATLVDSEMTAGNHAVSFSLNEATTGFYFYQFTAGNFSQTRKALLIK